MSDRCQTSEEGNAICVLPAKGQTSACTCASESKQEALVQVKTSAIAEKIPPNVSPSLWQKIRSGVMFGVACVASPCCTPLIVPLGLALLAGTPIAAWLTAHLGWVYGGLTLLSVVGLGLGIHWMNHQPHPPARNESLKLRPLGDAQMDTLPVETQPLFCDLTAIPATEREEHLLTAQDVFLAAQEVRELPNGYALRLPNQGAMFMAMARFVENERLCCPFFNFGLHIEANGGPLWLRLTGESEIKSLLLTTLSEHIDPAMLKQTFHTGDDAHLETLVADAAPRLGEVIIRATPV